MNRWVSVGCVLLCGSILAALAGCNKSSAQAGFAMPPAMVTTAPVLAQDVPVYIEEIGKTVATEVVTIVPQISGKIIERDFVDGSDLTEKQKLFQIDPRPFQATLDAADASVEQTQALLTNATQEFQRDAELLATKAVAQQDYDDKKNAVDVAQANLEAAKASRESAVLNLEYCTIVSPISGRAGQRLVDVGNVVNANTTPLLVIEKVAPIYVDFTVAENDLDRVRRNMAGGTLKVLVQTPDESSAPLDGKLIFLDNSVQDQAGTIKLRAQIDNTDRRLWPGQFVHVRLILATMHDALLVPREAVQIGQTGPYLYVLDAQNVPHQTIVKPGQKQGDLVVIESGISAGETIVQSGQFAINPDMPLPVVIVPSVQSSTQPATQPGGN